MDPIGFSRQTSHVLGIPLMFGIPTIKFTRVNVVVGLFHKLIIDIPCLLFKSPEFIG
jgi:hypothetical protein